MIFRLLFLLVLSLSFSLNAQSAWDCPTGKEGGAWEWYDFKINFSDPISAFDIGVIGLPIAESAFTVYDSSGTRVFTHVEGNAYFDTYPPYDSILQTTDFPGRHFSTLQNLTLPHPGRPGHYVMVFNDSAEFSLDSVGGMYCRYSTIDAYANNGLGEVLIMDSVLFKGTTERISATRHCNGEDWWIMTHEDGSNRFFAFLLDSNGIDPQPVISAVGKASNGLRGSKGGYIGFSPDGAWLAMTTSPGDDTLNLGFSELFRFDNATGLASDPLLIADDQGFIAGLAFSLSGRYLYISYNPIELIANPNLAQLDLSIEHPDSILNSLHLWGFDDGVYEIFHMQLGPDGRIYIPWLSGTGQLGVILNPESPGPEVIIDNDHISLPGVNGTLFVSSVNSFFNPGAPSLKGELRFCQDSGLVQQYYVYGNCRQDVTYNWWVNGGQVLSTEADSAWVAFDGPGTHEVIVEKNWLCGTKYDTIEVTVWSCRAPCGFGFDWQQLDSVGCAGDTLAFDFSATPSVGTVTIGTDTLLDLDSLQRFVLPVPLDTVTYELHLWQSVGCDTTVSFSVYPLPTPRRSDSLLLCVGDSVTIDGQQVGAPQTLNLSYPSTAGCDSLYQLSLLLHPEAEFSWRFQDTVCTGETTTLELVSDMDTRDWLVRLESEDFVPAAAFAPSISAGVYTLEIENAQGCRSLSVVTLYETDAIPPCEEEEEPPVVEPTPTDTTGFYAPTAFSPNGDGINDVFEIYMARGYELRTFRVFDRWGGLVHEAPTPWNPQGDAPQGVYVWMAEIVDPSGEVEVGSGDVVLVR